MFAYHSKGTEISQSKGGRVNFEGYNSEEYKARLAEWAGAISDQVQHGDVVCFAADCLCGR